MRGGWWVVLGSPVCGGREWRSVAKRIVPMDGDVDEEMGSRLDRIVMYVVLSEELLCRSRVLGNGGSVCCWAKDGKGKKRALMEGDSG